MYLYRRDARRQVPGPSGACGEGSQGRNLVFAGHVRVTASTSGVAR